MILPEYWWLLLPAAVGQAAFFIHAGTLRRREKTLQDAPRAMMGFLAAVLCGTMYAMVQRDPTLLAAQIFLLIAVYGLWRRK